MPHHKKPNHRIPIIILFILGYVGFGLTAYILLSRAPATEIEFVKGRIKFGKRDENGNFYLPLNAKGKTQSGTKDSMIVVFGNTPNCSN